VPSAKGTAGGQAPPKQGAEEGCRQEKDSSMQTEEQGSVRQHMWRSFLACQVGVHLLTTYLWQCAVHGTPVSADVPLSKTKLSGFQPWCRASVSRHRASSDRCSGEVCAGAIQPWVGGVGRGCCSCNPIRDRLLGVW